MNDNIHKCKELKVENKRMKMNKEKRIEVWKTYHEFWIINVNPNLIVKFCPFCGKELI